MNAVPFNLETIYEGLASGHGLLRCEDDHLCLEFQIEDGVLGVIKSEIKQVRIPLADVASVSLETTWFGYVTKLVVQTARMDSVKDVPGMKQGRLVLGVTNKDRPAAEQLVAEVQNPLRKS